MHDFHSSTTSEDEEEEGRTGIGIALTLSASGKAVELRGISVASGHGATADGTTVVAEKVGAAARDGGGVPCVGEGGSDRKEEGNGEESENGLEEHGEGAIDLLRSFSE